MDLSPILKPLTGSIRKERSAACSPRFGLLTLEPAKNTLPVVVSYSSPGRLTHLPVQVTEERAGGLLMCPQVGQGTREALVPGAQCPRPNAWTFPGVACRRGCPGWREAGSGLAPPCFNVWVWGVHTAVSPSSDGVTRRALTRTSLSQPRRSPGQVTQ